jgi:large subunit ribosomal protein L29
MRAAELRELTDEELQQRLRERHDAMLAFRMQQVTGTVDNVHAATNARRDIARILTILREREMAQGEQGAR